jgi:hypothetical protein
MGALALAKQHWLKPCMIFAARCANVSHLNKNNSLPLKHDGVWHLSVLNKLTAGRPAAFALSALMFLHKKCVFTYDSVYCGLNLISTWVWEK